MPLVVPVLRFVVVFLNVYETFKTLKPPPPSARRGGQPSVRAMSQRKRDLKGCLAVWVIWCCYAAYERTFDRIVGIFLPFYSEIKSVFLLFLLLTRAKGAEPLFLHVLRPLIKPYAAVVDPILELSRDLGDFFFALMQVPLDYILSSPWFPFPSWHSGVDEALSESMPSTHVSSADSGRSTRTSSNSSIPTLAKPSIAVQPSRVQSKRNGSIRSASDGQRSNSRQSGNNTAIPRTMSVRERHAKSASATSLPPYSEHSSRDPPRYSQTLPRRSGHQIWYPPASAYEGREEVPASTPDLLAVTPEYSTPEWRTYPAFPSAYPPTPLPASASLPTPITITRSGSDLRRVSDSVYPPIAEDPTVEQGFGELLERQRVGNPGPDRSSSNNNNHGRHHGVDYQENSFDGTQQADDDTLIDDSMDGSEAELSEDFDATLRTPSRSSAAYSSDESLTGALTTADGASSLRTQTSSESPSSESSLAGRKRSRGALQSRARTMLSPSQSRYATLRGRPAPPSQQDDLQSSPSEDDESEVSDDGGAEVKRQKVLAPPQRKTTLRPVARGAGNTRQAPLPTRGASVRVRASAASSQSTMRGRGGSAATTNQSTIRGRNPTLGPHQVGRGRPQGVTKTSSTSSQSGAFREKAR